MHKDRERDNSLDRLLRQTMPGLDHEPAGPCPDAETVAAWSEQSLRGTEAAAVEVHLAECARCQALLAAFASAMPPPEITRSLAERWHLRWLVPLGAAATAAAIWIAVPSNQPPEQSAFARPELESRQEAVAVAEPQQPTPTLPTTAPAPAAPRQSAAATPDAGAGPEAAKAAPAAGSLDTFASAPVVASTEQDANANRAQARSADTGATADVGGVTDRARAAPAPSAPPSPAAASAPAERPALLREEIALPQFVSPDPARRWRITPTGQVERSVSGGATWERVVIDPPATLIAGSSPDPLVCWFVGRGGVVYLTTNGTQFVRVPFPATVDLAAIRTPDARSATVTSSDGLIWRTTDLGRTWTGPTR